MSMHKAAKPTALEFFAGGGLARLGLAEEFDTVWANDFDPMKAAAWTANFGPKGFEFGDIHMVDPTSLPNAALAWASFPCQDLSLAGDRAGLSAKRSGAFYAFVAIIRGLQAQKRAPKILVIENVSGLLTSHGGRDFAAVLSALADLGYRTGTLEIDTRDFLPQSRPRVFVIAVANDIAIPSRLCSANPQGLAFVSQALIKACSKLVPQLQAHQIWWSLPKPPPHQLNLLDVIDPGDQNWWPQAKTNTLLASLSSRHQAALAEIQRTGVASVGAVYRRTRTIDGLKRPFAEVRFDGLAGCLRTPSGGSSRQFLLFVKGQDVRVRALNPREAMALMGVDGGYILPKSQLAALKIAGDGVAVPVVAWLSRYLLAELVKSPA
jgi:DNA (cytosine-5)-methyltransferase 1